MHLSCKVSFGEEGISLLIAFDHGGDDPEIRYLGSQDKEGEDGISRDLPPENASLVTVREIADAVLHEVDVQVCLDCLDGHEDETAELEQRGESGH